MSLISQTETYTLPGTYTYIVPPGISTVEFHLWGAGGANGLNGPSTEVQAGTTSRTVQTGTTQVQTGTTQVQTGTTQVQTGTTQVQTGTIEVQVGTKQEAYEVVVSTSTKGGSTKNNGKSSGTRTETRFRTVPIFETRPVFTTVPVFGTQPVFGTAPVFGTQPVFSTISTPVFESRSGGRGGLGAGGGYVSSKIQLKQGDVLVVYVGSAGVRNIGGSNLLKLVSYNGGNAGLSTKGGLGGGGGAATVLTLNDKVIAVAAGGGGGGGGGILGRLGKDGVPAVISGIGSGVEGRGRNSGNGPASGGGGGGGFFGGLPGSSGDAGDGGTGGVSFGTVIQPGSGINPGGLLVPAYPGRKVGFALFSGGAVLIFTKSFNINVKKINNWNPVDNAWVKVGGAWKDILNGWVKVDGAWEPLITERSIDGAEDLAVPAISYALSANRSNVAEGQAVSFTISTTGLAPGTLVPYTATGIRAQDLQVGALSGSFAVNTGSTITFVPRANNTTDGSRELKVILNNTGISSACTILDTSLTPVYSVTANVSTINEGQAVRFTLGNAFGVVGESITYNITGIESSRISSGSLIGTFVVGSSEQTTIAVAEDFRTTGNTVMTMTLVGKSASTKVTVVDTSLTPSGSIAFTPGTAVWTVPPGIFRIRITGCGGGGGGGRGDGGANNSGPGFGGGASNLVSSEYGVTPGTQLTVTVGVGGARGGSNTNGFPGLSTTVTGPGVSFTAFGGEGGTANNSGAGFGGLGANGGPRGQNPTGGVSTNGGANGGNGGPYNRDYVGFGTPGQNGILTIRWPPA
jgi:hypothetical protein